MCRVVVDGRRASRRTWQAGYRACLCEPSSRGLYGSRRERDLRHVAARWAVGAQRPNYGAYRVSSSHRRRELALIRNQKAHYSNGHVWPPLRKRSRRWTSHDQPCTRPTIIVYRFGIHRPHSERTYSTGGAVINGRGTPRRGPHGEGSHSVDDELVWATGTATAHAAEVRVPCEQEKERILLNTSQESATAALNR